MEVTPERLFLAMIALVAAAPGASAAVHWAYLPSPPLLQPVTWQHEEVVIYTNDTWAVEGHSSVHIQPVKASNFTYRGHAKDQPICFSKSNDISGCFKINTTKTESLLPIIRGTYTLNGSQQPWVLSASNWTRWYVDLWYPCGNASGDAIPPPEGVPLCEADFVNRTKQPHWMTCRGGSGKLINTIGGSPMHDWSAVGHKWKAIAESFWSVDKGPFQTQLWRLTAAMGGDIQANDERGNTAVLMESTRSTEKYAPVSHRRTPCLSAP